MKIKKNKKTKGVKRNIMNLGSKIFKIYLFLFLFLKLSKARVDNKLLK